MKTLAFAIVATVLLTGPAFAQQMEIRSTPPGPAERLGDVVAPGPYYDVTEPRDRRFPQYQQSRRIFTFTCPARWPLSLWQQPYLPPRYLPLQEQKRCERGDYSPGDQESPLPPAQTHVPYWSSFAYSASFA